MHRKHLEEVDQRLYKSRGSFDLKDQSEMQRQYARTSAWRDEMAAMTTESGTRYFDSKGILAQETRD